MTRDFGTRSYERPFTRSAGEPVGEHMVASERMNGAGHFDALAQERVVFGRRAQGHRLVRGDGAGEPGQRLLYVFEIGAAAVDRRRRRPALRSLLEW